MDHEEWAERGAHEQILQAVIAHLLTSGDLHCHCEDAGVPALINADGEPVAVTAARTYRDARVLTLDHGVLLELSDGRPFGLTVTISHLPGGEVTLRRHDAPPPASSPPRRRQHPSTTGRCTCVCASGGFCGGCGHAGCGRR